MVLMRFTGEWQRRDGGLVGDLFDTKTMERLWQRPQVGGLSD